MTTSTLIFVHVPLANISTRFSRNSKAKTISKKSDMHTDICGIYFIYILLSKDFSSFFHLVSTYFDFGFGPWLGYILWEYWWCPKSSKQVNVLSHRWHRYVMLSSWVLVCSKYESNSGKVWPQVLYTHLYTWKVIR